MHVYRGDCNCEVKLIKLKANYNVEADLIACLRIVIAR